MVDTVEKVQTTEEGPKSSFFSIIFLKITVYLRYLKVLASNYIGFVPLMGQQIAPYL